ncbi:hypothetical protein Taro_032637 [Colocasia esculenta]|uniref:Uncharacterized protein n=1 Tax=Colocasia esculenta TaxID=4460 RepID=A0A843W2G9_COLES|nr:hypothetical protein [Colocasia esculenta]
MFTDIFRSLFYIRWNAKLGLNSGLKVPDDPAHNQLVNQVNPSHDPPPRIPLPSSRQHISGRSRRRRWWQAAATILQGQPLCSVASLERHDLPSKMAKSLGKTGEFFKRRDEWRKHPMLTNQLRHATPGLGIALVAFGIYLVGEAAYNRLYKSDPHSH